MPCSPDADVGNQHPVPSLIFAKKQQQPGGLLFDRTRARPFYFPDRMVRPAWVAGSLEEDYRPPPTRVPELENRRQGGCFKSVQCGTNCCEHGFLVITLRPTFGCSSIDSAPPLSTAQGVCLPVLTVAYALPSESCARARLAHMRRSLCDGIWLNQSYIVFDRFYQTVHPAA